MIPTHLPDGIRLGREICGDLQEAERREWWLANRNGAYAAGTLAGNLTRRYHGLLLVPLAPPLGRFLVLAKADATLSDGEWEWPLFTNRWADGSVAPAGHVHIESFVLEGRLPVWRFAIGDIRVEQRIWLERERNAVHVAWRRLPGGPARAMELRVALLVNARDHHGVTRAGAFAPQLIADGQLLQVTHPGWFQLNIRAQHGSYHVDPVWIERFDLPLERERGLEDQDNHLRVGQLHLRLEGSDWSGFTAALDADQTSTLAESLALARKQEGDQLA
ncbi:MAG: glycogen debranching enzyme N-terminal domain-containing protein, partial [Betaproteobacteria bacterium]